MPVIFAGGSHISTFLLSKMSFISNLFNTSTMHLAINLTSEGSCLSHQVYSTGDEIAGEVVVTPNDDVHVDDLDISLIGKFKSRPSCTEES